MATEAVVRDECQRVLAWRLQAFQKLGIGYPDAWELALSEADIHEAQQLVERGCAPELLRRILA